MTLGHCLLHLPSVTKAKKKDLEFRNLVSTEPVPCNSHGPQLSFRLLPRCLELCQKLFIHILNKSQRQVAFKLIPRRGKGAVTSGKVSTPADTGREGLCELCRARKSAPAFPFSTYRVSCQRTFSSPFLYRKRNKPAIIIQADGFLRVSADTGLSEKS